MTTFVLVANASEARLFERQEKYGHIAEIKNFLHPESRLSGSELEDDRQGSYKESATGQSRAEGHGISAQSKDTDPKTREAEDFARELAEILDTARKRGDFDNLVIIAAPAFLGKLRNELDANTSACVGAEIDKNLTHATPEEICEAVDGER